MPSWLPLRESLESLPPQALIGGAAGVALLLLLLIVARARRRKPLDPFEQKARMLREATLELESIRVVDEPFEARQDPAWDEDSAPMGRWVRIEATVIPRKDERGEVAWEPRSLALVAAPSAHKPATPEAARAASLRTYIQPVDDPKDGEYRGPIALFAVAYCRDEIDHIILGYFGELIGKPVRVPKGTMFDSANL